MAVIETILTFGMGYLLAGGKSPFGKTAGKSSAITPAGATTPSKVPWPGRATEPGTELPAVPFAEAGASPAELANAVKDAEKYHAEQQARLDAQAHEAYQRAGSDEAARADIRRKYLARKKALDDYKAQVERAKGGIAHTQ